MNWPDPATEPLRPVVTALHQALGDNLIAVVLFGSRSRGDARPDSDWDLLLLAEGLPGSPWHRQQQIVSLLPRPWRHQVNVVIHTPAEWFSRVTPLALDIALDGVVIYDDGLHAISTRLAMLRQKVAQLGLERQAIDSEWIWLWRNKAQLQWELEWPI